jgi:predicted ATPase with chaperone activity
MPHEAFGTPSFSLGLTRRLTTILPDMTIAETLDITRIHRVAGLSGGGPS